MRACVCAHRKALTKRLCYCFVKSFMWTFSNSKIQQIYWIYCSWIKNFLWMYANRVCTLDISLWCDQLLLHSLLCVQCHKYIHAKFIFIDSKRANSWNEPRNQYNQTNQEQHFPQQCRDWQSHHQHLHHLPEFTGRGRPGAMRFPAES